MFGKSINSNGGRKIKLRNNFMKLLNLLIISLCFVNLSCAQAAPTIQQNQIVVINTSLFYDERVGIIPLISAVKPLNSELEPQTLELKEMIKKQQELSNQLSRFQSATELPKNITKETIDNKIKEYEALDCKIKNKTEEAKTLFEKRRQELTKDLRNDIAQSIKEFAKEKGYIIVVSDNSKELMFEDSVDATMEFIKFYHMSPKKK